MTENEIGKIVVDRALNVHKALGPGLLESTYEACLKFELFDAGLFVESPKALPVIYNEVKLDCGYRIDLLIENKVIIEIKSVEILNDVHMAQILTYLKLSGCKLGFLINFNINLIKDGIRRVVNHL
ncbi:MAG: GxxExxY protein [Bacteroidota bacterium]|jgi:GxxExxY protein